jgi:hypothetical protein
MKTPNANKAPERKPLCILVRINAKNAGPVMNVMINPAVIPPIIMFNISAKLQKNISSYKHIARQKSGFLIIIAFVE